MIKTEFEITDMLTKKMKQLQELNDKIKDANGITLTLLFADASRLYAEINILCDILYIDTKTLK